MQPGQYDPWVQAMKNSFSKTPISAGPSSPKATASQSSPLQPFGSEFYMVASARPSAGGALPVETSTGQTTLSKAGTVVEASATPVEASHVPRQLLSTTSTPQLSQHSTEAALRDAASRSQSMQLETSIPVGRTASADNGTLGGSKHGLHLKPSTSNHNMSASVNTPRLSIASTDMNSVWEYETVDLQHDPGRYSPRTVEAAIEAVHTHQAKEGSQGGRPGGQGGSSSTQGEPNSSTEGTQGPTGDAGTEGGHSSAYTGTAADTSTIMVRQASGASSNGGASSNCGTSAGGPGTTGLPPTHPYTLTGSMGHSKGRLSSSGSLDGGGRTSGGGAPGSGYTTGTDDDGMEAGFGMVSLSTWAPLATMRAAVKAAKAADGGASGRDSGSSTAVLGSSGGGAPSSPRAAPPGPPFGGGADTAHAGAPSISASAAAQAPPMPCDAADVDLFLKAARHGPSVTVGRSVINEDDEMAESPTLIRGPSATTKAFVQSVTPPPSQQSRQESQSPPSAAKPLGAGDSGTTDISTGGSSVVSFGKAGSPPKLIIDHNNGSRTLSDSFEFNTGPSPRPSPANSASPAGSSAAPDSRESYPGRASSNGMPSPGGNPYYGSNAGGSGYGMGGRGGPSSDGSMGSGSYSSVGPPIVKNPLLQRMASSRRHSRSRSDADSLTLIADALQQHEQGAQLSGSQVPLYLITTHEEAVLLPPPPSYEEALLCPSPQGSSSTSPSISSSGGPRTSGGHTVQPPVGHTLPSPQAIHPQHLPTASTVLLASDITFSPHPPSPPSRGSLSGHGSSHGQPDHAHLHGRDPHGHGHGHATSQPHGTSSPTAPGAHAGVRIASPQHGPVDHQHAPAHAISITSPGSIKGGASSTTGPPTSPASTPASTSPAARTSGSGSPAAIYTSEVTSGSGALPVLPVLAAPGQYSPTSPSGITGDPTPLPAPLAFNRTSGDGSGPFFVPLPQAGAVPGAVPLLRRSNSSMNRRLTTQNSMHRLSRVSLSGEPEMPNTGASPSGSSNCLTALEESSTAGPTPRVSGSGEASAPASGEAGLSAGSTLQGSTHGSTHNVAHGVTHGITTGSAEQQDTGSAAEHSAVAAAANASGDPVATTSDSSSASGALPTGVAAAITATKTGVLLQVSRTLERLREEDAEPDSPTSQDSGSITLGGGSGTFGGGRINTPQLSAGQVPSLPPALAAASAWAEAHQGGSPDEVPLAMRHSLGGEGRGVTSEGGSHFAGHTSSVSGRPPIPGLPVSLSLRRVRTAGGAAEDTGTPAHREVLETPTPTPVTMSRDHTPAHSHSVTRDRSFLDGLSAVATSAVLHHVQPSSPAHSSSQIKTPPATPLHGGGSEGGSDTSLFPGGAAAAALLLPDQSSSRGDKGDGQTGVVLPADILPSEEGSSLPAVLEAAAAAAVVEVGSTLDTEGIPTEAAAAAETAGDLQADDDSGVPEAAVEGFQQRQLGITGDSSGTQQSIMARAAQQPAAKPGEGGTEEEEEDTKEYVARLLQQWEAEEARELGVVAASAVAASAVADTDLPTAPASAASPMAALHQGGDLSNGSVGASGAPQHELQRPEPGDVSDSLATAASPVANGGELGGASGSQHGSPASSGRLTGSGRRKPKSPDAEEDPLARRRRALREEEAAAEERRRLRRLALRQGLDPDATSPVSGTASRQGVDPGAQTPVGSTAAEPLLEGAAAGTISAAAGMPALSEGHEQLAHDHAELKPGTAGSTATTPAAARAVLDSTPALGSGRRGWREKGNSSAGGAGAGGDDGTPADATAYLAQLLAEMEAEESKVKQQQEHGDVGHALENTRNSGADVEQQQQQQQAREGHALENGTTRGAEVGPTSQPMAHEQHQQPGSIWHKLQDMSSSGTDIGLSLVMAQEQDAGYVQGVQGSRAAGEVTIGGAVTAAVVPTQPPDAEALTKSQAAAAAALAPPAGGGPGTGVSPAAAAAPPPQPPVGNGTGSAQAAFSAQHLPSPSPHLLLPPSPSGPHLMAPQQLNSLPHQHQQQPAPPVQHPALPGMQQHNHQLNQQPPHLVQQQQQQQHPGTMLPQHQQSNQQLQPQHHLVGPQSQALHRTQQPNQPQQQETQPQQNLSGPHGQILSPGIRSPMQMHGPGVLMGPGVVPGSPGGTVTVRPPGAQGSTPPPGRRAPPVPVLPAYPGLLYIDGRDTLQRPVVVVNTHALPRPSAQRKEALQAVLHTLEPLVQGPYVLVVVAVHIQPLPPRPAAPSPPQGPMHPQAETPQGLVPLPQQQLQLQQQQQQLLQQQHQVMMQGPGPLSRPGTPSGQQPSQQQAAGLSPSPGSFTSRPGTQSGHPPITLSQPSQPIQHPHQQLPAAQQPGTPGGGSYASTPTTQSPSAPGTTPSAGTTPQSRPPTPPSAPPVIPTKVDTLTAFWAVAAYKQLAKPYRKNVKHIVLVQPSAMARFLVSLAKGKGEAKIKRVSSLEEVTHATEGEVTLHSLGFLFLRDTRMLSLLGPPPPKQPRSLPASPGMAHNFQGVHSSPGVVPSSPGMVPSTQGVAPSPQRVTMHQAPGLAQNFQGVHSSPGMVLTSPGVLPSPQGMGQGPHGMHSSPGMVARQPSQQ